MSAALLERPTVEEMPSPRFPIPSGVRSALAWYGSVAGLALLGVAVILRLDQADLRVPLDYSVGHDRILFHMYARTLCDQPWCVNNPALGAPGTSDLADYPLFSVVPLGTIKILALLTRDWGLAYNLAFLLTFPLTALSGLFALRRLGLSSPVAAVACLLYTFLPAHFQYSILLGNYYCVPLVVLVLFRLYFGEGILFGLESPSERVVFRLTNRATLGSVAVCVLTALGVIYYGAFACYFLLAVGVAKAWQRRHWYPLANAGLLVAVVVTAGLVCAAPNFVYQWIHGGNPAAVTRGRYGPEIYGLKLVQMVAPVSGHRLRPLARAKDSYNAHAPLVNENDDAALGAAGAVGLFLLFGWVLAQGRAPAGPMRALPLLSLLTVCGVLLATVGGFGAILALGGGYWIRGYNRISIYLGFFSFTALGLTLDYAVRRWAPTGARHGLALAGLAALLLVGVFDQASVSFTPNHRVQAEEFALDRAFVGQVEQVLPPGAMIFQTPYIPFPEAPPVARMVDYDHFRASLHARSTRWSYGAVRGRDPARWQEAASGLATPALLEELVGAGFTGLWVDRAGYEDHGVALEAAVTATLGAGPVARRDGRVAFYDLRPFAARLAAGGVR